jgi:type IV secretory pathway TrbL component
VKADLCSLEMRALATAKMASKGMKRVEIDVGQNVASPLHEAAEMGGGSNVSNGAARGVSVAFEVIRKRVNVWSTDSTPQAS